jgi:hypothetical protein
VTFDHPRLGHFGILNIYAPTGNNTSAAWKLLWREVFASIPNHFPWLMIGDFNMMENVSDQSGGHQKILSG